MSEEDAKEAALARADTPSQLLKGVTGAPPTAETAVEARTSAAPSTSAAVPFVPITLVCRDIRYFVPNPAGNSAPVATDDADPETAGQLELLKARKSLRCHQIECAAAGSGYLSTCMRVSPESALLLQGLSVYAEPGSLTALMGGSGAGKTTFMDVIAGRKTQGEGGVGGWGVGEGAQKGSWNACR